MIIIGLTGGIATGKSTVSKQLRTQYHKPVVDADAIAHDVVEPGTAAYKEIVRFFGEAVPDLVPAAGAPLNRAALGRAVFNNDAYRHKLNGIVHPAVRKEIAKQVLEHWLRGSDSVVLDVPLLFETGLDKFCGVTLAVLCSEDTQLERLRLRDPLLTEAEARARIAAQMPLQEKRARADVVLDNDGDLQQLFEALDALVRRPPFLRPWWLTLLQWFPPVGALWAFFVFWKRGYAI